MSFRPWIERVAALPAALHVILAAFLLLGVAAANGRPAAFPDTAFYYSQGRYVASALGLAAPGDAEAARRDPTAVRAGPAATSEPAQAVAGARWPIWGVLLYAAHRLGSLWGLAGLQSLLCTSLLWLAARALENRRAPVSFWGLTTALALGTSLPFFAAFLMPDIFAALAALGAALLIVHPDRLSRREQAALAVLVALSAALHPTGLALLFGMAAMAAAACALPRLRKRLLGRAALMTALAAAATVLAFSAQTALDASLGHGQGQPPFLAARVLADGPGRIELAAACRSDTEPYALCRYRRLRLDNAEDILWAVLPDRAVWSGADPATRRRISAEQLRFAAAATARAPLSEASAALGDWGRQLLLYRVEEPLRNPADYLARPDLARTAIPELIPDMAPCRRNASACKARFPYGWLMWAHGVVLLLSTTFVGWRLSKPDARAALQGQGEAAENLRRHLALMGLLAGAILINAAVCGVISGPFARYEARLVWLWPMGALLLAALVGWPPREEAASRKA